MLTPEGIIERPRSSFLACLARKQGPERVIGVTGDVVRCDMVAQRGGSRDRRFRHSLGAETVVGLDLASNRSPSIAGRKLR